MSTQSKRRLSLKLTGMTCGGCIRSVQKILANINGVIDLDVRVGAVTVLIDPQRVQIGDICDALHRAGYGADLIGEEPMETSPNTKGMPL